LAQCHADFRTAVSCARDSAAGEPLA